MGLDMYLYRKCYVKNWDHTQAEKRHEFVIKQGGKVRKDIKPERIAYIIETVAYWRKANAIHKWFVDNCQGGVDDCRDAHVSTEQLGNLVSLCKQVLNSIETVEGDIDEGTSFYADGRVVHHTRKGEVVSQKAIAASALPTHSGFFFGGTDYDEGYISDLKETIEMIEPLLSDQEGEYEYHSSW